MMIDCLRLAAVMEPSDSGTLESPKLPSPSDRIRINRTRNFSMISSLPCRPPTNPLLRPLFANVFTPQKRTEDLSLEWVSFSSVSPVADTFAGFHALSRSLYSGSFDRTLKIWSHPPTLTSPIPTTQPRSTVQNLNRTDLDTHRFAFVDALYGHEAEMQALSCLQQEQCVTVGTDHTLRLWRIQQQKQLVFKHQTAKPPMPEEADPSKCYGVSAGLDCVASLNDNRWITGGQDGAVCTRISFFCHSHRSAGLSVVISEEETHLVGLASALRMLDRLGGRHSILGSRSERQL